MSIAKNVGSLSKHFARIRTRKSYIRFKHGFAKCVQAIPLAGKPLYRFLRWIRDHVRNIFAKNILFEHFHLKYFGTVDGHNLKKLISALEVAKEERRPALVHVHTVKGKGFPDCEARPDFYHGVAAGLLQKECPFSKAAGEALCEIAAADEKVVAVTAAMKDGTGLAPFAERFPDRFFDVGIAEQHAATFACGLAKEGFKPFFAVYSTFLQRAFDQVVIDGCANDLPIKLLVDRAGLVGADGRTHQGVFDVSYLCCIPDMTLLAPKDAGELRKMIRFAKDYPHPIAIRYPNSEAALSGADETSESSRDEMGSEGAEGAQGKRDANRGDATPAETDAAPAQAEENFLAWEVLREGCRPCAILAAGNRLLAEALRAAELTDATVISARCLKPLDTACLERVRDLCLVTMEENVLAGGFGSAVAAFYAARGQAVHLTCLGVGDTFVRHATVREQFAQFGLTAEHLVELLGRGE